MKKFITTLTPVLFLACQNLAQPMLQLVNYATGFTKPLDIAHCGDDRLFIVEQDGAIWILDKNGDKLPTPFLNINARVNSNGNEQGLLGLAFHPDYASNGYFYVNYTNNSGDTRVSRFSVSANDPNVGDPDSELNLIAVDQPFSNHNGGCLKFGPDGYLYIGLGDGGSGGDPQNNGQTTSTMLGKMLRIDVDNGSPYAIPPSNPFVNNPNILDEIWALGLRNPWRYSFDRLTGDLWIADVGQSAWEEVDFQPADSPGGENYGWRCYEGAHVFPQGGCSLLNTVLPVAEYPHSGSTGCSITGGFVYRGCRFPQLYGHYLYTDYCTGIIWSVVPDGVGGWTNTQLANLVNNQFVTFGENKNGELFMAGLGNGIIYQVTESTAMFGYETNITDISCPGAADGAISLSFPGSTVPWQTAWSNGTIGPEITNLAQGSYSVTVVGENGCTLTDEFTLEPAQQLSAELSDETCPGEADGAITVSVVGAGTFGIVWDDGSSNPERTGLAPGTYAATVTSDLGCVFVETFTISTQFPAPATPVVTLSADSVLTASPGFASYQWLLNGSPILGADSQTYIAQETGDYSVVVTNNAGCEAVSDLVSVSLTGLEEAIGFQQLSLTPNPFDNTLTIRLRADRAIPFHLSISDSKGAEITATQGTTPVFDKTFDLSPLSAGVYFVKIRTGAGEWVEKVVKK